jgi:hypothetical protein
MASEAASKLAARREISACQRENVMAAEAEAGREREDELQRLLDESREKIGAKFEVKYGRVKLFL